MNKYEYIYMDFEFGDSNKRYLSLVCVSMFYKGKLECYDLRDENGRLLFRKILLSLISHLKHDLTTPILVSYAVDAEIRGLFSVFQTSNLKELPIQHFICLKREHRMLANKYKDLTHGAVITDTGRTRRQFIAGKSTTSQDFKFVNLINALWKFLGIFDQAHLKYKNLYRDICIRQNPSELELNMGGIIDYCNMDTRQLPALHKAMVDETIRRFNKVKISTDNLFTWQLRRGFYGALIAEKTQYGYNIDTGKYFNILGKKQELVNNICRRINAKWPEKKTFVFNPKLQRYVFKRDSVIKFIEKELPPIFRNQFPRTKIKKELSVNQEALEKLFGDFKYELDENNYLHQIYKYLRTASTLSGLTRRSESKTGTKPFISFFDESEGVVRPYYNDFGSSTGRSQPAANGYLLAKPAWMRSLLVPPRGHVMVAADFSKQEVLYLACLAQDKALIQAYASGDPYVDFGLRSGLLNEKDRGTPKWEIDRSACKSAVLGIFYGMGSRSLALKLSARYNRVIQPYVAQKYINAFDKQYPDVAKWKKNQLTKYKKQGYLMLKDGWTMWHNSYNSRSIINNEIQGGCGAVMREFEIQYRLRYGRLVPMTLHDGFYTYHALGGGKILFPWIANMIRCLRDAFVWGLNGVYGSDLIDIDLKIIGPDIHPEDKFPKISVDEKLYPITYEAEYIDKRAINDLKEFGRYMFIQPQDSIQFAPPVIAE